MGEKRKNAAAPSVKKATEERPTGLTYGEVAERKKMGQINHASGVATKSVGRIVASNLFTLFNILNLILAALIIWVGQFMQLGFLFLIISNIVIGLVQEIRAKRTVDKLSLISAHKATAVRDGCEGQIGLSEIVLDDVLRLSAGDQISSDCVVIEGWAEVNESMVTGESDPVPKAAGAELIGGSFVVSGSVYARVVRVGMENYASKITADAKCMKKTAAEIPLSLRAVIRLMSFAVVPLGVGIFLKSLLFKHTPLDQSVLKLTASVISMIPQGLVALSTVVFAASIVRLSKHRTLSQDLYCIETLARVDVLCLDKTGTLTEGRMQLEEIIDLDKKEFILPALSALTGALPDENPTFLAIREFCAEVKCDWKPVHILPFSSARKWSGASFSGEGSYLLGATEFLLNGRALEKHKGLLERYAERGERVLCLCCSKHVIEGESLPSGRMPIAFLILSDRIRKEAPLTLQYFRDQGVEIKIISGDHPVTVSAVATRAGLRGGERFIDLSQCKSETEVRACAEQYTVFGRVSPEQKRWLVCELKKRGHTVAMTGDGVNDVLALKEADCSIAMAEGSGAARAVSHLVLLDSNFSAMPRIVAEGRRTINNLQRTASLYLVKTVYSILLAVFFLFVGEYPFEPMHLTLIGSTVSGIPSVFLALEPNDERVQGRFLTNVLKKSFPGAIAIFLCIVMLQILQIFIPVEREELSTVSVLLIAGISFGVLFGVCKPMKAFRAGLFFSMLLVFFTGWNFFGGVFNLIPITEFHRNMYLLLLPILGVGIPISVWVRAALEKKQGELPFLPRILRIDKRG